MKSPTTVNRNLERRGAMLPMVALTMVILFVAVVFSIEIAYMHMVRAELRTATDAAARAGAETLARTQDENAAIDAALAVAELNNVAGSGLQLTRDQVELGATQLGADDKFSFQPNQFPLTAVRIAGDRTQNSIQGSVPLFFGRLLGQANFQPTQTATASSSVRDIALVLDRSGSMARTENGSSRIEDLKAAVQVFIDEINTSSPSSTISLTTYSTNSSRNLPLTTNFNTIENQVQQLQPDGFTNIFQALQQGSDSLAQDPNQRRFADKTIILMTDGNFNVGGTPVPSAQVAAARGHQIHTITFSSGANQGIMQQVAQIGEGTHIHADNGDDLAEAFREIARSLAVLLVQ